MDGPDGRAGSRPGLIPTRAPGCGPSPVDRKREAIIDAAAELMATRPMTDISVREIAARAAVPHTLIYRYLGNKQDLERAVIDRTINEVLAFTEPSPEAALGGLDRLIYTLLHRQDSLRVIINSMLTADGAARHSDRAPVIALFLASLRSDIDSRRAAGTPQPTPAFPAPSPRSRSGPSRPSSWLAASHRAQTGLTETPTEDLAALATAILNLARP